MLQEQLYTVYSIILSVRRNCCLHVTLIVQNIILKKEVNLVYDLL